jgi:hypothetical protein
MDVPIRFLLIEDVPVNIEMLVETLSISRFIGRMESFKVCMPAFIRVSSVYSFI